MEVVQRILVIDDDADIGDLVSAAAEAMGFQCIATTNPTSFLESLTAETTLVLLDLMMPDMDGVVLMRLLAKRKCRAGIVLMSGVGKRTIESTEQFAQAMGLCVAGHLEKPFRIHELEEVLRRLPKVQPLPIARADAGFIVEKKELQDAIKNDEFVVYYQPQIDIRSGRVIGVEALVRWRHPTRGLVFPDNFIGRMEEFGLIDQLGWIVADRGMSDVGQFARCTGKDFMLSMNASVNSLCDLDFPDTLALIAEKHGVSPQSVTIEITETGLIKEDSRVLDTLTRLRIKKMNLSIDDFGTGYAMMQQLKNIPATELKIDKSFIQEMTTGIMDRIMVQKTIEMGHELGMHVIAEGVETEEQLDLLRSYGCDSAQGYLFSRPIPAQEMVNWLENHFPQAVLSGARGGEVIS
jgi:EAL domain-containing protein (putative c-di-GMP-specific phosphodiesterase class I)/ActR/RegA family two-component response regulator